MTLKNIPKHPSSRIVCHFTLASGFNPGTNIKLAMVNFTKCYMTADKNYPSVFHAMKTIAPNWNEVIQVSGRRTGLLPLVELRSLMFRKLQLT